MDPVAEHLRLWAVSDFVWGVSDCSLVLADYVQSVTGKDGAAGLRGRYHDRESCIAVSGLGNGLVAVVGRCAGAAGLIRTVAPIRGDIGVLRVVRHEVGGLCLGDDWAVKSPDGVLFVRRADVVAAWAVLR